MPTVKSTTALVSVTLRYEAEWHPPAIQHSALPQAIVHLHPDGTAAVDLYAFAVSRKDVTGTVSFDQTGAVTDNDVEDSFNPAPLTPYVLRLAETRARHALREARGHLAAVVAGQQGGLNAARQ